MLSPRRPCVLAQTSGRAVDSFEEVKREIPEAGRLGGPDDLGNGGLRRVRRDTDEGGPDRGIGWRVNYRCPEVVLDRAVRLVEHNTERFAKVIRAREGAIGSLIRRRPRLCLASGRHATRADWRRRRPACAASTW